MRELVEWSLLSLPMGPLIRMLWMVVREVLVALVVVAAETARQQVQWE